MSWWESIEREGYQVPLLLMVLALGGVMGIAIAIGFKWLELSNEMANFTGGVAGAALGAAGGALTAIIVLRKQRRESFARPLNIARMKFSALIPQINLLKAAFSGKANGSSNLHYQDLREIISEIRHAIGDMAFSDDLPMETNKVIKRHVFDIDFEMDHLRHVTSQIAYKERMNEDLEETVLEGLGIVQDLLQLMNRIDSNLQKSI